jgi:hypothetical protein
MGEGEGEGSRQREEEFESCFMGEMAFVPFSCSKCCCVVLSCFGHYCFWEIMVKHSWQVTPAIHQ